MKIYRRIVAFSLLCFAIAFFFPISSGLFLFIVSLLFVENIVGGFIYLSGGKYIKLLTASGVHLGAWIYLTNYPKGGYPGMNIGAIALILLFVVFPCFVYMVYAVAFEMRATQRGNQ